MSKLQWITLMAVEIILGLLLILKPSLNMLVLFLSMQLILLTIQKANLIKSDMFYGARFIRRTVYFIPYILAICFFLPKINNKGIFILWAMVAFVLGLLFFLPRMKELLNLFNKDFISLLPPVPINFVFMECYSLFGSAILQELFYRVFIIGSLYPLIGAIPSILISGFLFTVEHFIHHSSKKLFTYRDYFAQFLLSMVGGLLYLSSGYIFIPIILHVTYNSIIASSVVFRFTVSRKQSTHV